jgi:hypothetical protein
MKKSLKSKKDLKKQAKAPVYLGLGFPPQLGVTHKYVDEFTLTSALGIMANYRFRASGMFDPNHTAAGHQPSYYDNLTAIYDHWVVTRSTLEIVAIPTSTPAGPTAFGVALNDDTTTVPTSFVAYEESSDVKVNYLTAEPGSVKRVSIVYNPNIIWPGHVNNRAFWGDAVTDPAEETIFNVFLQAVDQVSTVACFCVAKVTYEVLWFELKDLVVS